MPSPNFNFAAYLGGSVVAGPVSASISPKVPTLVGAILAFLGIFAPELWLCVTFQCIWWQLRTQREVLLGIHGTAVWIVFTVVYRAKSVNRHWRELWWLVVAESTFTAVEWFGVPPPVVISTVGATSMGTWGCRKAFGSSMIRLHA